MILAVSNWHKASQQNEIKVMCSPSLPVPLASSKHVPGSVFANPRMEGKRSQSHLSQLIGQLLGLHRIFRISVC